MKNETKISTSYYIELITSLEARGHRKFHHWKYRFFEKEDIKRMSIWKKKKKSSITQAAQENHKHKTSITK